MDVKRITSLPCPTGSARSSRQAKSTFLDNPRYRQPQASCQNHMLHSPYPNSERYEAVAGLIAF